MGTMRLISEFIPRSFPTRSCAKNRTARFSGKLLWAKSRCRIMVGGFHRPTAGMRSTFFEHSPRTNQKNEEDLELLFGSLSPRCRVRAGIVGRSGPGRD